MVSVKFLRNIRVEISKETEDEVYKIGTFALPEENKEVLKQYFETSNFTEYGKILSFDDELINLENEYTNKMHKANRSEILRAMGLEISPENYADKEYIFKINKSVPFEEQNLMEETKDIFANFFRDYWATDFQREQILIKEKQDEYELEKNKIKINYDEVFKNKKIEEKRKTELTVIPEKKWYEKFLDYIKNVFKFKK